MWWGEEIWGGGGERRDRGRGAVPAPPAPATRGREEKGEEIGGEKRKEGTAVGCSVGLKTSC